MKNSKENLIIGLEGIYAELKSCDISEYPEIKMKLADFLDKTLDYLANQPTITAWQKEQIFHAFSGILFSHLFYSINAIKLIFEDPNNISPENKYTKEIASLTLEDIKKSASVVRKYI